MQGHAKDIAMTEMVPAGTIRDLSLLHAKGSTLQCSNECHGHW